MELSRRVLNQLADEIAGKIAKKTIRYLQTFDATLYSESGLESIWDEICVQRQGQDSFFWYAYEDLIYPYVLSLIPEIPHHHLCALWLKTDAGFDWLCDQEAEVDGDPPVFVPDVVTLIVTEYVLSAAQEWSNPRIREYLDTS